MHVHIGFIKENKKRFKLLKMAEPLILWYKNTLNCTERSIFSHHIWGYYRESEYSFKRKRRYQPIVYTKHNTAEFRCFDYQDLFNNQMIRLFTILIYKMYKKEPLNVEKKHLEFFKVLQNVTNDNDQLTLDDIKKELQQYK